MTDININFSALVTAYTTQRRRDVHCIYSNTNLVRVGIIYIKECRIAHRVVLTALLAPGMLCTACFLMFKNYFVGYTNTINIMFNFIDIYSFIPVSGCPGNCPVCPCVRTALLALGRFRSSI
jgi:hypothetical protein